MTTTTRNTQHNTPAFASRLSSRLAFASHAAQFRSQYFFQVRNHRIRGLFGCLFVCFQRHSSITCTAYGPFSASNCSCVLTWRNKRETRQTKRKVKQNDTMRICVRLFCCLSDPRSTTVPFFIDKISSYDERIECAID